MERKSPEKFAPADGPQAAAPGRAFMRHVEFLRSCADLAGIDAADVGAGDGAFARELAAAGARVTGIEIAEARVAEANAASGGNPTFLVGRGEDLPLPDGSQDLVCFIFSFHHIPADLHGRALAEALRVLRPAGRLHFSEPLPDAPERNVLRTLDDETEVRTVSHARLSALDGEGGLRLASTQEYEVPYDYADVEEFIAVLVRADAERARRLPEAREELVEAFVRTAQRRGSRYVLPQPCRAYHFEADA